MADRLVIVDLRMDKMLLPWLAVKEVIEILTIRVEISFLSSNIPEWSSVGSRVPLSRKVTEVREKTIKILRKATRFQLIGGILYEKRLFTLLLMCISAQETQYILAKIHKCECENH